MGHRVAPVHTAPLGCGADVIIRIEPGDIRAWDYADELGTLVQEERAQARKSPGHPGPIAEIEAARGVQVRVSNRECAPTA
jgi:hypothetical protein